LFDFLYHETPPLNIDRRQKLFRLYEYAFVWKDAIRLSFFDVPASQKSCQNTGTMAKKIMTPAMECGKGGVFKKR
jgi:hypothetical protein